MITMEHDLLDVATQYLRAIEVGATGDALARFYTDDAAQEEFPNRLVPNGAKRGLAAILDGAIRGQAVVAEQRFKILNSVVAAPWVALEVAWTATLRVPVGSLPAGGEMRARFGLFMKFRGDRIELQHNYDCFDPF